MKIRFCGAAREVTGSCHLIQLESGYKILLDCGLFQGRHKEMDEINSKWYFDPAEIDCMILSHAHIDHSGRIPKFVKDGFKGCIHSTHATRSLCAVMLLDSAKIQEREAEYTNKNLRKKKRNVKAEDFAVPLYTTDDVGPAMERFNAYSYERWFSISKDVEVLFRDAGHILGSASVTLRIRENGEVKTIGFTGDIGRPNRPILRDPKPMPEVDFLICESTYGDKEHMGRPDEKENLLNVIKTACCDKKGNLIIPTVYLLA
jgi:metallo-beta-lactamase family protein